jgi:hypothetical protein
MAAIQENSQIISENLDLFVESDDLENHERNDGSSDETDENKFADLIKRSQSYLLGLTFVAGLLLGWIIIGWWLWPVQWANSEPWHLRPRHQRMFVRLVAEDYWQTSDIYRAREALAGWDEEALAELLAKTENQAASPEERQHLAALAEALEMTDAAGESFVDFFLNQKAILLSSILSASPLVAALAFAAYSLVQNRTQQAEALLAVEEQLEEDFEELLALGEEAREGRQDQEEEQDQEGEQQEQNGEQQEQEEQQDEEGEEEYEEDDEEEIETFTQDLVFDLFDEDDTEISHLQAICQSLPDIDASDLLERSKQTANDLHRGNALRQG